MEHLSNPNNWSFLEIVSIMGLDYIRYKHKSLPLIAEQEEGDDFFYIYVLDKYNISEKAFPGVPGNTYSNFQELIDMIFSNFITITISEIGFLHHKSKFVKKCNETTELYTD